MSWKKATETPFYLLVIRYNFRNRTREKARDLLKAAQPPGNMKAHGAIFARGARARRTRETAHTRKERLS